MASRAFAVHDFADRSAERSQPLDLVELARRSFGDEALEREVLAMFLAQSKIHVNAILTARDGEVRRRAAHTLKGAARAIGAIGLARCAERAERPAFDEPGALRHETERVCAYIETLLAPLS
jgi:HPt (histidine-containing phosphotransfer) domain-containing protein